MPNQPTKSVKVILIDPYKREVRKVEIGHDLATWHQLLRCDCLDCQRLTQEGLFSLNVWFDDEFLLKEPLAPGFVIVDFHGAERQYRGYAFLCASNDEGDAVSIGEAALGVPDKILARLLQVRWESYEMRLGQDAFIDLRIRTPELEMPGRFKFLDDICPGCGKVSRD